MPIAFKVVGADYKSAYLNPFGGSSPLTAAERATLALNYGVGNVVTPDSDLEQDVKEASDDPLVRLFASRNNGIWVLADRVAFSGYARGFCRHAASQLFPLYRGEVGRVVQLTYDAEDALKTFRSADAEVVELLIRSATVSDEVSLDP